MLILIIALFVDRDYQVSRSVTVEYPKTAVFEYLRYLKNQEQFTVWNQMDPDMKKEYINEDGNVGAIFKWTSKNEDLGSGELEIKEVDPYDKIVYELRLSEPWESTNKIWFDLEGQNHTTVVKWSIEGKTPYPFNFLTLFMDMDEMMGSDLEQGLENLKKVMESKNTITSSM